METMNEVERRVEAGINWLNEQDKILGNDTPWFKVIDLGSLDLGSACNCVLGQSAHHILPRAFQNHSGLNYTSVVLSSLIPSDNKRQEGKLLTFQEAMAFGFELDDDYYDGHFDKITYSDLQIVWYKRISELQNSIN